MANITTQNKPNWKMNFSVSGVGVLLNYFFPVFSFIKLFRPHFLIHLLLQQEKKKKLIKDSEDLWALFFGKKNKPKRSLATVSAVGAVVMAGCPRTRWCWPLTGRKE